MKTFMAINNSQKMNIMYIPILLLESICEVRNKYNPQTFLDEFFEKHNDNNKNCLFKELVQIID